MGCHPSHWRTPSFFKMAIAPPTRYFIHSFIIYSEFSHDKWWFSRVFHSLYHLYTTIKKTWMIPASFNKDGFNLPSFSCKKNSLFRHSPGKKQVTHIYIYLWLDPWISGRILFVPPWIWCFSSLNSEGVHSFKSLHCLIKASIFEGPETSPEYWCWKGHKKDGVRGEGMEAILPFVQVSGNMMCMLFWVIPFPEYLSKRLNSPCRRYVFERFIM